MMYGHRHNKKAARKAKKNPHSHGRKHARRHNPYTMKGAGGVLAAGLGMGLVAIGTSKLLGKVGNVVPAGQTAPRLSAMAQGLIQTGAGVVGGVAISEMANMPRAGAAWAGAHAAVGLTPVVRRYAPSMVNPASGINPPVGLPAGNRQPLHASMNANYVRR